MADIGFDRTDGAIAGPLGPLAPGLAQRGDLDGIAQPGARAVRFHQPDAGGINARLRQRLADHLGLATARWRIKTRLVRAVVVERDALDQGIDIIAVGDGIFRPFQKHDRGPLAGHHAVGLAIKGLAAAVRGKIQARLEYITNGIFREQATGPDQGRVHIPAAQRHRGQLQAHQRRRTIGMH